MHQELQTFSQPTTTKHKALVQKGRDGQGKKISIAPGPALPKLLPLPCNLP